jgi:sugar lactone lactonase YvrE
MNTAGIPADFEVAVPPVAALGEGPRWDDATGTLLWVDIVGRAVHRYDPRTGDDQSRPVRDILSLALPRSGGGVLVGMPGGIYELDAAAERPAPAGAGLAAAGMRAAADAPFLGPPLVPIEAGVAGDRTNDGACDPSGRLWVGTMARDERSPTAGLYRIDLDLSVTRLVGGTTISNGLGWSPDGGTFYFIDSPTRRVDAFDFDAATGAIERRRPLAVVDVDGAVPDGMTVDAEGCLWVALHGGWGLRRFAPDGELLAEVRLPVARITSCCFGGPGLRDLYVTTRRDGLSDAESAQQPLAGALLRLDPGVAGLPTYAFRG